MKNSFFIYIFLFIALSGCRTLMCDNAYTANKSDIEHAGKMDSTRRISNDKQFVFVHDSVFVSQKNDTITRELYRTRYLYKYKTDTLVSVKRDTTYICKTDTITVQKIKKVGGLKNEAFELIILLFFIFLPVGVIILVRTSPRKRNPHRHQ